MADELKPFEWDLPLYIIAPRGRVEPAEAGFGEIAGGLTHAGERYVAIYQTEADACGHMDAMADLQNGAVGVIADAAAFRAFLRRMQQADVTYLAINPVNPEGAALWPVAVALRSLGS